MKRKKGFWTLIIMILSSSLLLFVVNWVQAPDFGISSPSFFATSINDIIDEDTVWKVADSPYIITGNIIVDTNVTLTIEPGVVVKFAGYYYLMVKGTLKALGSQLAPITFTSNASLPSVGDWNGIQSSGFNSVMNLNHTKIEYASTGIYNNNGNVTLVNSEISFNDIGIYYFQHSYPNVTYGDISGNVIKSNDIGVQIDIQYGPMGELKLENNAIISNDVGVKLDFFNNAGFNLSITQNIISLNKLFGVKIDGGVKGISFVNITQNYVTFNDGDGIYLNLWDRRATYVFFIQDNDVHGNTAYDFELGRFISHIDYTFDASRNYWGTNDMTRIDKKIYDFHDDHKLGKVDYIPILDSPLESRYLHPVIDHVKPTISIYSPLNGTYANLSNVSIAWNGYDAGSGIDYYAVKLDDNAEVDMENVTNYMFSNVSEGMHTAYVLAFDKVGNIGETLLNFSVDLTPPIISTISVINGSEIKSSLVNLTWSGSDEVSGIDHYEIKLDTDEWIDVAGQTDYTFTYLRDGSHTIILKAFDKAQNSREITLNLIVNTSFLWAPGWIDDVAFFSVVSMIVIIGVYYFSFREKKED